MTDDLHKTPNANRIHIALFGKCNTGKSSLINALTNQNIAIVSDVQGTTTDPIYKAMEIKGLGACVFIDTAGFDDTKDALSKERVKKTKSIIEKTDIALIILDACQITSTKIDIECEKQWYDNLQNYDIPTLIVINKIDSAQTTFSKPILDTLKTIFSRAPLLVSAKTGKNLHRIIDALKKYSPINENLSITGHLVNKDATVLLIMPQDIQAPTGRLILPQVQTIRDLLDHKAIIISATFDKAKEALNALKHPPQLIITDSQMFKEVAALKPKQSILTSFSVLFARYKGNIDIYKGGANHIDNLTETSRVLIAESCTHNPMDGDIGREKIPNLLRKKIGKNLHIDVISGTKLPENLSTYDLVIQCGGCMMTRKFILNRIKKVQEQKIAITNYGMAIAKLTNTMYSI